MMIKKQSDIAVRCFLLSLLLSAALTSPVRAGWQLEWIDSFEGSRVNKANWTSQIQANYNQEVQCYTDDDSSAAKNYDVSGGTLKIIARRQANNCAGLGGASKSWTSGRLNSKDKREFLYGRIESRIRFDNLKGGSWPAFWMLENRINEEPRANDNDTVAWPNPGAGEIDVWEWFSNQSSSYITNFFNTSQCGSEVRYTYPGGAADVLDWHDYAIEWEEDAIRFFIDDHLVTSHNIANCAQYKEPMFILLNVAMGGTLGGAIDSTLNMVTMEVDYVAHCSGSDANSAARCNESTPVAETVVVDDLVIFENVEKTNWAAWDCCGGSTPLLVNDDASHEQVMEFTINGESVVGFTARSPDATNGMPFNASSFSENGTLEFDLKMTASPTSGNNTIWKLKVESQSANVFAEVNLSSSNESHAAPVLNTWQHYRFNLSDLAVAGLDLSKIDLVMVFPEWGSGDGAVFRIDNLKILKTASPVQEAPVITSSAITSAMTGNVYDYQLTATDADALTLTAPVLPSWLTFNTTTGRLSGTPSANDAGVHQVTLTVSDGTDAVSQSFAITVTAASENTAPRFTSDPVLQGKVGNAYSYTLTGSDAEGDDLQITATTSPSWLSFNTDTEVLSGTPATEDEGTHRVTMTLSDGTNSVTQTFTITVVAADVSPPVVTTNTPPQFTSDPILQAKVGDVYRYGVTATDADGDDLQITATTLPSRFSFNSETNILSSIPATVDEGTHAVTLVLSDGTDSVTQSFTITVMAAGVTNTAPTFMSTPVSEATVGSVYRYTLSVSDADGDDLQITAVDLPSWLSFNSETATLSGTPTADDIAMYEINMRASDGQENSRQVFNLTVIASQASDGGSSGGGNMDFLLIMLLGSLLVVRSTALKKAY